MSRARLLAAGAALAVVAGFAAANAHLVAVALGSQPACVLQPSLHGGAAPRAAKPAC